MSGQFPLTRYFTLSCACITFPSSSIWKLLIFLSFCLVPNMIHSVLPRCSESLLLMSHVLQLRSSADSLIFVFGNFAGVHDHTVICIEQKLTVLTNTQFHIIHITQEQEGPQDAALGDPIGNSICIWQTLFNCYDLFSMLEIWFKPFYILDSHGFKFVTEDSMIYRIKGESLFWVVSLNYSVSQIIRQVINFTEASSQGLVSISCTCCVIPLLVLHSSLLCVSFLGQFT